MPRKRSLARAQDTYGSKEARKWFVYWRLFYLACSELFKYDGGEQYGLMHALFVKPAEAT